MPTDFINLIPYPEKVERLPGNFLISDDTALCFDDACSVAARYFSESVFADTGITIPPDKSGNGSRFLFQLDPSLNKAESYMLKILPEGIHLTSRSSQGVFHGVQTLLQLIFQYREPRSLPCLLIEDSPRFSWRALMLDEARHFQGKTQVLRLLDIMARLKMNIFHWHLTDDQGWRIEIKKYPRLTEIGAKRAGTAYRFTQHGHNHIPHSGCYTRAEIQEVVAYAAARNITIVPEIEFPGHATAALAAYPEFSCTGGPFEVATHWGIFQDIYCPGKPQTLVFLQNILSEVIDLFPGKYVHIGGDEAPKVRWRNCPDCLSKASELKIEIPALQTWFTNRLIDYLRDNGRRAIGWSETFHADLDGELFLQHWLPQRNTLRKALQQNRNVIVSPYLDVYLDHTYELISLKHIYEFDPVPCNLNEKFS
jgi:hexosaminidase